MPVFGRFDKRGYPVVGVRQGYSDWAASYEHTVEDTFDVELLQALRSVEWESCGPAVDLGCGTGRTARWLAARGVGPIHGVDLTPEMLERARNTGSYRSLTEADLRETGLASGAYTLATVGLADEHLPSLPPLYEEARRLTTEEGIFVLVGLHPQFLMVSGMPTHYERGDGVSVAIETHVHSISDHVAAAAANGWALAEMREREIDDALVEIKPRWEEIRGHPVSIAYVWRKVQSAPR